MWTSRPVARCAPTILTSTTSCLRLRGGACDALVHASGGATPRTVVAGCRWPCVGGGIDEVGTVTPMAAGAPDTFFDYAPVHIVTTSSLRGLSGDRSGGVPAERFRPNIVIETDEDGFVENDWVDRRLRLGAELLVEIVTMTPRCAVPALAHGSRPRDVSMLRSVVAANRVVRGGGRFAGGARDWGRRRLRSALLVFSETVEEFLHLCLGRPLAEVDAPGPANGLVADGLRSRGLLEPTVCGTRTVGHDVWRSIHSRAFSSGRQGPLSQRLAGVECGEVRALARAFAS